MKFQDTYGHSAVFPHIGVVQILMEYFLHFFDTVQDRVSVSKQSFTGFCNRALMIQIGFESQEQIIFLLLLHFPEMDHPGHTGTDRIFKRSGLNEIVQSIIKKIRKLFFRMQGFSAVQCIKSLTVQEFYIFYSAAGQTETDPDGIMGFPFQERGTKDR